MQTIYLVDGSGYIFRAYYAIAPLSTSKGLPSNALLGFTRMIIKLLRDEDARYVAVMFDTGEPTFRHKMFDAYKANRGECPEDLIPQMPYFRKIVQALGIPCYEKPGYEADDIIATLAKGVAAPDRKIVIVSGDKDLTQLVGEGIEVWDPMRNVRFTPEKVREKFGVGPQGIVDYLALVGDSSDNIPGVKGVGPKGALKLLEQFGNVEQILQNIEKIEEIKGLRGARKIRETVESDPEILRLSKELVTLDHCVKPYSEISGIDELLWRAPDSAAVTELFEELEFSNMLETIPRADLSNSTSDPAAGKDKSYQVITSETLNDFAAELASQPRFAFDTETTSLDVLEARLVGMSFSWERGSAYYLPLIAEKEPDQALDAELVKKLLAPVFARPSIAKVGLNLKFDIGVLEENGYEVNGVAFDVMLSSYVMKPDSRQHSLSALCKIHLGEDMQPYKELVGDEEHIGCVPLAEVARYACHDAEASWALYEIFNDLLGERAFLADSPEELPSLRRVFEDIEMPLLPVLSKMERRGILVDRDFLAGLGDEFVSELEQLEAAIYKEADCEFNINSPKQLSEVLFEKLGLPTKGVKKTQSGFSTNHAVLEKFSGSYDIADLLLSYRELHKLKTTYIDALSRLARADNGRVHSSFNQAIAATGRLSSSDPNLQNIPIRTAKGAQIRKAFIAEQGSKLISADYSQIELRVLAHLSGDAALRQAFIDGQDIHEATAKEIFGEAAMDGEKRSELRRYAKTINFGIIYGISAFRLARELGISRTEAQRYIDEYFGRYPDVAAYFDHLELEIDQRGYVETMFGRRRFKTDIDAGGRDQGYVTRSLLNAPIQGSAAEIIKCAMIRLEARLTDEFGPDARILLQVHDELVVEAKSALVDDVASVVSDEMQAAYSLAVPLVVDVRTGLSWGGMK